MNYGEAEKAIKSIFSRYGAEKSASVTGLSGASHGKIYELWTLAKLLEELRRRHYRISYSHPGKSLAFKAAPGLLKQADPHFDIRYRAGVEEHFQIFLNIEFATLGSGGTTHGNDASSHHELDIGVFSYGQSGYPPFSSVALGIECKAVATITKEIVRGVLGLRRELSVLTDLHHTVLKGGKPVPAYPPSELRLVTTDKRIANYQASPAAFGVECIEMMP